MVAPLEILGGGEIMLTISTFVAGLASLAFGLGNTVANLSYGLGTLAFGLVDLLNKTIVG
jgi:hypothetical protein